MKFRNVIIVKFFANYWTG